MPTWAICLLSVIGAIIILGLMYWYAVSLAKDHDEQIEGFINKLREEKRILEEREEHFKDMIHRDKR